MQRMRNEYKILGGKREGKSPLGRNRRRWGTIVKWISRKLGGNV
jgi:hypothetical protein